eukprot:372834_1
MCVRSSTLKKEHLLPTHNVEKNTQSKTASLFSFHDFTYDTVVCGILVILLLGLLFAVMMGRNVSFEGEDRQQVQSIVDGFYRHSIQNDNYFPDDIRDLIANFIGDMESRLRPFIDNDVPGMATVYLRQREDSDVRRSISKLTLIWESQSGEIKEQHAFRGYATQVAEKIKVVSADVKLSDWIFYRIPPGSYKFSIRAEFKDDSPPITSTSTKYVKLTGRANDAIGYGDESKNVSFENKFHGLGYEPEFADYMLKCPSNAHLGLPDDIKVFIIAQIGRKDRMRIHVLSHHRTSGVSDEDNAISSISYQGPRNWIKSWSDKRKIDEVLYPDIRFACLPSLIDPSKITHPEVFRPHFISKRPVLDIDLRAATQHLQSDIAAFGHWEVYLANYEEQCIFGTEDVDSDGNTGAYIVRQKPSRAQTSRSGLDPHKINRLDIEQHFPGFQTGSDEIYVQLSWRYMHTTHKVTRFSGSQIRPAIKWKNLQSADDSPQSHGIVIQQPPISNDVYEKSKQAENDQLRESFSSGPPPRATYWIDWHFNLSLLLGY